MDQILLAYGLPKETVRAITMPFRNTKAKVYLTDEDTYLLDIVPGVFPGKILVPYYL